MTKYEKLVSKKWLRMKLQHIPTRHSLHSPSQISFPITHFGPLLKVLFWFWPLSSLTSLLLYFFTSFLGFAFPSSHPPCLHYFFLCTNHVKKCLFWRSLFIKLPLRYEILMFFFCWAMSTKISIFLMDLVHCPSRKF